MHLSHQDRYLLQYLLKIKLAMLQHRVRSRNTFKTAFQTVPLQVRRTGSSFSTFILQLILRRVLSQLSLSFLASFSLKIGNAHSSGETCWEAYLYNQSQNILYASYRVMCFKTKFTSKLHCWSAHPPPRKADV